MESITRTRPRANDDQMHTFSYRAMEKLIVNEDVTFNANYEHGVAWAEKKDASGNRILVMKAQVSDRRLLL